jgi:hypothetical protein
MPLTAATAVVWRAYIRQYEPTKSVDDTMGFREKTGGCDLVSVDKSERLHIAFRVKEKGGEITAMGKIDVKDAGPARSPASACGLCLRASLPPT